MIPLESGNFHYDRRYPQSIETNVAINSSKPSGLTIKNSMFCLQRTLTCFIWISEHTAITSLCRTDRTGFWALSQNRKKRLLTSSCLSVPPTDRPFVCLHGTTRLPVADFYEIWYWNINSKKKLKFHYNLTRISGPLHEDQYTFFIISRSMLLRMKYFYEGVVE